MVGKRTRNTRPTSKSPTPKRQKKSDDPSSWTVVDLRAWLSTNNLPTKGRKDELVERVKQEQESDSGAKAPTKAKATQTKAKATNTRPRRTKAVVTYDESDSEEENFDSESESDNDDKDSDSESEIAEEKAPTRQSSRAKAKAEKDSKDPAKQWKKHDTICYYNPPDSHDSEKIAAFDMDTTLIIPASGKTHPQGRSDWKWMFDCIPKKLEELHKDGYKVVIISNQKGITTGNTTAAAVQGKILDLQKDCGVPLCAILASADDDYRKPSPKMFDFLCEKLVTVPVDFKKSYYIGDAAGRPAGWKAGKKKDFGCSDRKFARNVGIDFKTPEEFFLGEDPVEFDWRTVDPTEIAIHNEKPYKAEDLISKKQEMIIFVGFPASGKSTFAKEYLVPNGYVHVNRDTLKTKCLRVAKEAVADGKSVVVDNTNPSVENRKEYINVAKGAGIPVRCFYFQTDLELAKHLNNFRENITKGDQPHVPRVAYAMFSKKFVAPDLSEGFTEIREIEFKRYHPDEEHKKTFDHWTERA